MSNPKQFVFDTIDRNCEALALLCDNIFYFAELGMQEFETSGLMTDLLGKGGLHDREELVRHADGVRCELRRGQTGDRAAYRI